MGLGGVEWGRAEESASSLNPKVSPWSAAGFEPRLTSISTLAVGPALSGALGESTEMVSATCNKAPVWTMRFVTGKG